MERDEDRLRVVGRVRVNPEDDGDPALSLRDLEVDRLARQVAPRLPDHVEGRLGGRDPARDAELGPGAMHRGVAAAAVANDGDRRLPLDRLPGLRVEEPRHEAVDRRETQDTAVSPACAKTADGERRPR